MVPQLVRKSAAAAHRQEKRRERCCIVAHCKSALCGFCQYESSFLRLEIRGASRCLRQDSRGKRYRRSHWRESPLALIEAAFEILRNVCVEWIRLRIGG